MRDLFGDVAVRSAAGFSPCLLYRYWLTRTWGPRPALVVLALNPSTADEKRDDPTSRRSVGFARAWGHDGLELLNLFAFRSTDPSGLIAAADPVGPENDATLLARTKGKRVLCAWGAHPSAEKRAAEVLDLFVRDGGRDLICLGRTASGAPRHPLYVPGATRPEPFVTEATAS